jgi:signal transduction histidine kinase
MVLVGLLFVGSISALAFNVFSTQVRPAKEREIRDQLRAASRRMAEEAGDVLVSPGDGAFDQLNARLSKATRKALANSPGIEGGFYLAQGFDRFAGYAFPSEEQSRSSRAGTGKQPKKRREPPLRTDPPPMETPYIRLQAQDSLHSQPGEFLLTVRDIKLSRVLILTEPVGDARPAALATWLMFRLVDPAQWGAQVKRYQASTGFAIGGLALALGLTFNLGRKLRKQSQEQRRLREELRRSEHLAALGMLLAGVAHEVRNPLAAIRSTVQLWQRLPDTARNPDSLEAVIQAVDRLNSTVSQLLVFARADHSARDAVRVDELWRETLDLLAAQADERGVERLLEAPADLPQAAGSAGALRQVFLNLATNALQAMPDGGRLEVRVWHDRSQDRMGVDVSDNGPGIAEADRAHLFEPFFTTRPEGTGLGLALCRELIVQHGGEILYLPDAAQGATFRLYLPAWTTENET